MAPTIATRPQRPLPGTLRVGIFLDGRDRQVSDDGQTERGHLGVYLSADQMVVRERGTRDQGLGVFARFGWTDSEGAPLGWFWSCGGDYRGLLPRRGHDTLGLAACAGALP